jgi:hypothetical protein
MLKLRDADKASGDGSRVWKENSMNSETKNVVYVRKFKEVRFQAGFLA